uniref:GPN-loop GTPase n=1 Tax=Suricata suricatta TaxID=37032 RepID=A0A673T1F5_SURSU
MDRHVESIKQISLSSTIKCPLAQKSHPIPPRALKSPILWCLLVLRMVGSGKTTSVQNLMEYLHSQDSPPHVVNLDPAVHEVSFPANIIHDIVKYKEVMKQYGLGPNGGCQFPHLSLGFMQGRIWTVLGC